MEFLQRFLNMFKAAAKANWPENVGPLPSEHPPVPIETLVKANTDIVKAAVEETSGHFTQGWWSLAKRVPMHPGRIGRAITPRTLIVHTTDMRPGTFNAVVKSWTSQPGKGNGAHFLLGKDERDGCVQFASTVVNANHAGGPNCGGYKLPNGKLLNPNLVGVGIEIDNAGRLTKDKKGWYQKDTGHRFAPENVFVDDKGRGWERVTDYQMKMLAKLWTALKPTLTGWPSGSTVVPNEPYEKHGSGYAKPTKPSLTGHCSTNVINKTDPGPQVMVEINKWA